MGEAARSYPQVDATLKQLEQLAQRKPEVAEAAAFYRAAAPLLREAQEHVPVFDLDPDVAQRKLETGRPLLVGEDLPLDGEATAQLFLRLCRIVENGAGGGSEDVSNGWSPFRRRKARLTKPADGTVNGDGPALRATAAGRIRKAVAQNELDLAEVWGAVAIGDQGQVERLASRLQLEAGLLNVLAQHSLKPSLRAWAQGVTSLVDLSHWRRGQCPLCGNAPTLSEVRGKEGERRLRCARCGAGWYYPRLQCAFCRNRDHKRLGYIAVEGEEEKYRLQTCDACRGYIKMVVTYDPIMVESLVVEDLTTLHLDAIGVERGFVHQAVASPNI